MKCQQQQQRFPSDAPPRHPAASSNIIHLPAVSRSNSDESPPPLFAPTHSLKKTTKKKLCDPPRWLHRSTFSRRALHFDQTANHQKRNFSSVGVGWVGRDEGGECWSIFSPQKIDCFVSGCHKGNYFLSVHLKTAIIPSFAQSVSEAARVTQKGRRKF